MDGAEIVRALVALGLMVLVLVGLQAALRYVARVRMQRGRLLDIVETHCLPGAASLHVVAILDRYFLIGRGGAAVALLAELPAEAVRTRLHSVR
jgi:flagellar biogenesis protein FliO